MEKQENKAQGDIGDHKRKRIECNLPIPIIPQQIGTLFVCGQGNMGQLGLGEDIVECKWPTIVKSMNNIVDISAGVMHTLCLTKDGELYSFGRNEEGALGRDTIFDGSEFLPEKISLPGKCVKITAGDSHSACLLEDGRVFAWGSFRDSRQNMGLTSEGNKHRPIEVLTGLRSCDISSGADHLAILTCIGKVFTMGCAEQGQLGRVSPRSASGNSRRGRTELLKPGIVTIKEAQHTDKIWATSYCTFVKEFGKQNVYAFGLNNHHQLGLYKKYKYSDSVAFPRLTKFENVKAITGGLHHTLLLKHDNKCYTVGRRDYCRRDYGNIPDDMIKVEGLKKIIGVSCGETQSFAIRSDGKVYAWGMGSCSQFGAGSEYDELVPVLINSKQIQDKNVIKVSAGEEHTLFLVANKDKIKDVEPVRLKEVIKSNR